LKQRIDCSIETTHQQYYFELVC